MQSYINFKIHKKSNPKKINLTTGLLYAKTNLSAICPTNISLNADIRSIYERMAAQGKPKGVIFNRIKCIIVKRMFAVIRRGTPFECRVDSTTL